MIILAVSFFSLGILFLSGEALAYCVPDTSSKKSCIGELCQTVGESKLDGDNYNIIACLRYTTTPPATDCCKWSATSTYPRALERKPNTVLHGFDGSCADAAGKIVYAACSNACDKYCATIKFPGTGQYYTGGFLSVVYPDQTMGCSCFF